MLDAADSNNLLAPFANRHDSNAETAKNLLQVISHHLLDRPERISIDVVAHASEIMVQLQVPHDEMGKMIGRNGRTANSLRCLLAALSEKTGTRFTLNIVERFPEVESIPPLRDRTSL